MSVHTQISQKSGVFFGFFQATIPAWKGCGRIPTLRPSAISLCRESVSPSPRKLSPAQPARRGGRSFRSRKHSKPEFPSVRVAPITSDGAMFVLGLILVALALLALPRWGDAARRSVAMSAFGRTRCGELLRLEIGVDEDELVRWRLQTVRPRLVALFSRFT